MGEKVRLMRIDVFEGLTSGSEIDFHLKNTIHEESILTTSVSMRSFKQGE